MTTRNGIRAFLIAALVFVWWPTYTTSSPGREGILGAQYGGFTHYFGIFGYLSVYVPTTFATMKPGQMGADPTPPSLGMTGEWGWSLCGLTSTVAVTLAVLLFCRFMPGGPAKQADDPPPE